MCNVGSDSDSDKKIKNNNYMLVWNKKKKNICLSAKWIKLQAEGVQSSRT